MRVLAVLVVLAAVGTASAATAPIAARTPVETVQAETNAFNARHWAALWSAYTPTYKAHCGPYSAFAKGLAALRNKLGPLTVRVASVRQTPSKAYVAYQTLNKAGKVVQTVTPKSPDLYVRIKGLWYDEYEPAHGC